MNSDRLHKEEILSTIQALMKSFGYPLLSVLFGDQNTRQKQLKGGKVHSGSQFQRDFSPSLWSGHGDQSYRLGYDLQRPTPGDIHLSHLLKQCHKAEEQALVTAVCGVHFRVQSLQVRSLSRPPIFPSCPLSVLQMSRGICLTRSDFPCVPHPYLLLVYSVFGKHLDTVRAQLTADCVELSPLCPIDQLPPKCPQPLRSRSLGILWCSNMVPPLCLRG